MDGSKPRNRRGRGPGRGRRLATWLHARRGTQLRLLLAAPMAWMILAYLGSLFILLLSAFWEKDAFTGQVEREDAPGLAAARPVPGTRWWSRARRTAARSSASRRSPAALLRRASCAIR